MTKNTIIGIIVVAVIIIGGWLALGGLAVAPTPNDGEPIIIDGNATSTLPDGSSTTTATSTNPGVTSTTTVKKINPKDPWQVLGAYVGYLKAHNIEGVKSLSHQQSTTCADPKKQKECFALMDDVYALAKDISAEDYPVKMEDKKQLVLLTPTVADNSSGRGYRQGIIVFTKTSAGDLRVLYVNPLRGWYVNTSATDTSEATEQKLQLMMIDEDKDAVEDRVEACVSEPSDCVKTDANKRDTDGDGWWDGVERFFKK